MIRATLRLLKVFIPGERKVYFDMFTKWTAFFVLNTCDISDDWATKLSLIIHLWRTLFFAHDTTKQSGATARHFVVIPKREKGEKNWLTSKNYLFFANLFSKFAPDNVVYVVVCSFFVSWPTEHVFDIVRNRHYVTLYYISIYVLYLVITAQPRS